MQNVLSSLESFSRACDFFFFFFLLESFCPTTLHGAFAQKRVLIAFFPPRWEKSRGCFSSVTDARLVHVR